MSRNAFKIVRYLIVISIPEKNLGGRQKSAHIPRLGKQTRSYPQKRCLQWRMGCATVTHNTNNGKNPIMISLKALNSTITCTTKMRFVVSAWHAVYGVAGPGVMAMG